MSKSEEKKTCACECSCAEEKKENKSSSDLVAQVEQVLDSLRINLQMDGGDIQLVEITEDKVVKVHFLGACCGCPGAQSTLKFYIERAVKDLIPDIKEVVMA